MTEIETIQFHIIYIKSSEFYLALLLTLLNCLAHIKIVQWGSERVRMQRAGQNLGRAGPSHATHMFSWAFPRSTTCYCSLHSDICSHSWMQSSLVWKISFSFSLSFFPPPKTHGSVQDIEEWHLFLPLNWISKLVHS